MRRGIAQLTKLCRAGWRNRPWPLIGGAGKNQPADGANDGPRVTENLEARDLVNPDGRRTPCAFLKLPAR